MHKINFPFLVGLNCFCHVELNCLDVRATCVMPSDLRLHYIGVFIVQCPQLFGVHYSVYTIQWSVIGNCCPRSLGLWAPDPKDIPNEDIDPCLCTLYNVHFKLCNYSTLCNAFSRMKFTSCIVFSFKCIHCTSLYTSTHFKLHTEYI